jgi:hypothetical protein
MAMSSENGTSAPACDPRPCSPDCDGDGWLTCWKCGGAGVFCGCFDDVVGECPELECSAPVACEECGGDGHYPCSGSLHGDGTEDDGGLG